MAGDFERVCQPGTAPISECEDSPPESPVVGGGIGFNARVSGIQPGTLFFFAGEALVVSNNQLQTTPHAMCRFPKEAGRNEANQLKRILPGSFFIRKAPCFNMGRWDGKNRQGVYLYTPAPHTTNPTSRGQKFPCLKRRNTPNVSSATHKKQHPISCLAMAVKLISMRYN